LERQPTVGPDGLIGVNIAPLLPAGRLVATGLKLTKTGQRRELAATQTYHYITVPAKLAPADGRVRPCIQETTLAAYQKDPAAGIEKHHLSKEQLYPPDHKYPGRQWAMVIDLSRCTGCSACVVACQAENNIPVVGRDEVRRRREMHWMRIDRYYKGDGDEVTVAHQPMLCQHCENAPCEAVCPVLATVHTEEGLNAQAYNGCVGTRYCANNCPYKVRRFNWFNYRHDDPVENLLLNPNVTVRTRGVMEKCSFCVQRIQEATIAAKKDGKLPADGVIQTACQQSCPAQAIVFGDRNDPNSVVHQARQNPRHYRVLEELDVRPAIGYLTLVHDRPAAETGKETRHHG
jgi:molybdopterin-containing oxidoreductase family iron-sulfur binding subunit